MTDLTSHELGGHALPAHIRGVVPGRTTQPSPRKRRAGLVVSLLGVAVLATTLAALQVGSNLGYDDAEQAFESAVRSTTSTVSDVEDTTAELTSTADAAARILENDSGALAAPSAKDALAASVVEALKVTADSDVLLNEEIPTAEEKPAWFWELYPASERLDAQREEVSRLDTALEEMVPDVEASTASVTETGSAFIGTAASAASTFEAAHLSARNDDVIALRDAASDAAATTTIDSAAVDVYIALEGAASQVVASEQAEMAEKSGPLQGVRLEVEAFARSLAPGVLLEFDWSPLVNNAGYNGSMGGLTTWWWDEPDRAVIELSDSVAEQWPAVRSRSLVAHEVGHAISVKCEDMYDSSTADSIEKWATAWAISMGYTDDANGVWAYGYPPQSYIDAAYGCR